MYLHAEEWKYGAWTLAGVLTAGTLFQSLSNAIQYITPRMTYVGTGVLALLTIGNLLSNEMAWNTVALSGRRRPPKKHGTHSGLLRSRNNSFAMVPSGHILLRPHKR